MEVIDVFYYIAEIFDELVLRYGAFGICLAMFAESAGIPFASALVILTAGQMIASGKISVIGAVMFSIIGITLGSLFSYLLGFLGRKIGRAINISVLHKKVNRVPYQQTKLKHLFERYGNFSIFVAQLIGTTRTFISFPAGAMQMNIFLFLIYTALGGTLFSIAAIGFSIVLNRTLSLIYRLAREILALPVWVWFLVLSVLFLLLIFYFTYRYYQKNVVQGRK